MQIKQKTAEVLELTGSDGNIFFLYPGAKPEKTEEAEYNVGFVEADGIFNRPGEYEVSEVSLVGIETRPEAKGVADIFSVTIEGVNFLFLDVEKFALKKDQLDLIGGVDVLVLNLASRENAKGIIGKVDPSAVVVVNFESAEQVAKETDLSTEETVKKVKFSKADFSEEESSAVLYLLTK